MLLQKHMQIKKEKPPLRHATLGVSNYLFFTRLLQSKIFVYWDLLMNTEGAEIYIVCSHFKGIAYSFSYR